MNPTNVSQSPSTSESGTGSGVASTVRDVKGAVAGAAQTVKEAARDTAAQIKNTATETATQVKQQASEIVSDRKEDVANRIGGVSSSIHETAKSMEEKDPNIAWITHEAANRIQKLADYVRNRDFEQLRDDAGNLARRHPAAFFGGLFLTGLVVGNLIKATSNAGSHSPASSDFQDGSPDSSGSPAAEDVGGSSNLLGSSGPAAGETMT